MDKEKFISYLEQERESCMAQEQRLIAEERKDEANLCKVEANIYDIFKTLYQVSLREEPEKQKEFFLHKAKTIPANWQKSYEAAKEHQDVQKILIEETKLAVVRKIMDNFQRLWEEEV